jgi:hypothetical protein
LACLLADRPRRMAAIVAIGLMLRPLIRVAGLSWFSSFSSDFL